MATLFVIQGTDQGSRFELASDVLSLGRDAANPVRLHDTEVSRQHAEVRRDGDRYVLVDLGSSNGTFVNGHNVRRHELQSGDQIEIGRTVLLYSSPQTAPRTDLAEKPWSRR